MTLNIPALNYNFYSMESSVFKKYNLHFIIKLKFLRICPISFV